MQQIFIYGGLLFVITCIGGIIPLGKKHWNERNMQYLLAFSGSFLLGITLLHLIPENVQLLGERAGILILSGFFLQQIVQRFTHGVEHGHVHTHTHNKVSFLPIFAGLALHAFSEGIPLGTIYNDNNTLHSLYVAVALHKLPEAMLIASLVLVNTHSKNKTLLATILFALITPLSAIISYYWSSHSQVIAQIIEYCIPIVAGSFLHIATTIFFESGTRSHDMNWKKWLAIISGGGIAILTLLSE